MNTKSEGFYKIALNKVERFIDEKNKESIRNGVSPQDIYQDNKGPFSSGKGAVSANLNRASKNLAKAHEADLNYRLAYYSDPKGRHTRANIKAMDVQQQIRDKAIRANRKLDRSLYGVANERSKFSAKLNSSLSSRLEEYKSKKKFSAATAPASNPTSTHKLNTDKLKLKNNYLSRAISFIKRRPVATAGAIVGAGLVGHGIHQLINRKKST